MEAHAANFLEFIEGRKQFGIPIYQRAYSWNTKQCLQLWNDIIKASEEKSKGHFIGSIVYIQPGLYKSTSMTEMHVIDGQQRLVTLSLLLKAVAKALEKSEPDGNINSTQIHNYYLLNSNEKDGNRRKLLLNGTDKDTLFSLIDEIEPPKLYSNQIVKNYKFFEERINSNSIALNKLYEGINKLFIVDVALERGKDNPQLIFESLNSTGLDLSQADLIRNYVLMGLEPEEQKRIYEKYWYPMENDFTREEYTEYFDKF